MKAKEQIKKLVLDNDFITKPRLIELFLSLLDRVETEAVGEFKNLNKHFVVGRSEQLFCPHEPCQSGNIYSRGNKHMCGYCGEQWEK